MNPLLSVCIVLVTASFVAAAIAAIRAMTKFSQAIDRASETSVALTKLLDDATRTSAEIRELAVSLEAVSKNMSEPAAKFGEMGNRIASISTALLDEVEDPLRKVASLLRTIRTGVLAISDLWSHRAEPGGAPRGPAGSTDLAEKVVHPEEGN